MPLHRLAFLLVSILIPVCLTGSASAAGLDPRFGAVDAFFAADRADELGVGWSRVLFPWSRVQPDGPNDWWPAIPDRYLDDEARRGRQLAGVLVSTPRWAATAADRWNTTAPRGLDLPVDSPANLWGEYVRRTASAYRGRIDTWVIWNEPDVSDRGHDGYAWSGSIDEFARLQKVAYLAAKRGNPEARVTLPGVTYWWDKSHRRAQFLERYLEVVSRDPDAPANGWYFDAAVLQLYNDPRTLYDATMEYRRILDSYGVTKPIWINETNVAPWDDPDRPLTRAHWRANQWEQANYFIQAYAMALAAGVERLSIYKMSDDAEWRFGWESYGVARLDDRAPRPVFTALGVAHRQYAGVTRGQRQDLDGAIAVTLWRPDARVTVIWATEPRAVRARISASGSSAWVHERDGGGRAVLAVDGQIEVDLAPATHNTVYDRSDLYLTGGPPLIVVEPVTSGAPTVTVIGRGEPIPDPDVEGGALQRAIAALRAVNAAAR
ncbi:MAG: hypothetical protein EPO26_03495 [Chloroflexota bacterium]|nr:MAG: hypothetical protein EPO26_03495 [Chloroflexota bacterium]